jgi:hypothetical protein
MSGWSVLVYLSAAVVYFAVAATIWGWIRHVRRKDRAKQ